MALSSNLHHPRGKGSCSRDYSAIQTGIQTRKWMSLSITTETLQSSLQEDFLCSSVAAYGIFPQLAAIEVSIRVRERTIQRNSLYIGQRKQA